MSNIFFKTEYSPGPLIEFTGRGSSNQGNEDERQMWQLASDGLVEVQLVEAYREMDDYDQRRDRR